MNDYNAGISGTGRLLIKIGIMKLVLSHGKVKLTLFCYDKVEMLLNII